MRTTLDLPEEIVSKVIEISGKKKKNEAVRLALEEYIRQNAEKELLSLPGTVDIEDVSEELEELELEDE